MRSGANVASMDLMYGAITSRRRPDASSVCAHHNPRGKCKARSQMDMPYALLPMQRRNAVAIPDVPNETHHLLPHGGIV